MPSSWRFSASLWRRRDGSSSTPSGVEGWPETGHKTVVVYVVDAVI
jgi:hypothetical protein